MMMGKYYKMKVNELEWCRFDTGDLFGLLSPYMHVSDRDHSIERV